MVVLKNCIKYLMVISLIIMVSSCSKARKKGGELDTPDVHYTQGMKFYEDGKITKAEEEFKLAQSLDKKYAPAYIGLALCEASKKNYDKAYDLIGTAIDKDKKDPKAHIAKGMIITFENRGKDNNWIKKAVKAYDQALKYNPKSGEAFYRKGWSYKQGFMFSEAAAEFKKCLDLNGEYTKEANAEWAIVQMIERAAPGTKIGKKIAIIGKLSRSDICALFINELDIVRLLEKKRPKNYETGFQAPESKNKEYETEESKKAAMVTDIADHWAKNFIEEVMRLKIRGISAYPDHTFRPNVKVTRSEYALMVEDVLIGILRDPSLATKHIGAGKSRFPDVNASSPYYNAICNAVDKNVMDAELNGEFGISKEVSGAEALLVIRKLKELNK